MFHVFNSTYIANNSLFDGSVNSIVINGSEGLLPSASMRENRFYNWSDFVDTILAGDKSLIWEKLYRLGENNKKFILYVDSALYLELQLSYWKSVLPHLDVDSAHTLHKLTFEDSMLRCHLPEHMLRERVREAYRSYPLLSRKDFESDWMRIESIQFLKNVSKDELSFEFQVADYFVNSKTPLKAALLAKIGHFSWVNWVSEIFILKTDIINAIQDVNRLLPPDCLIDVSVPGAIYSQIVGNKYLNWILDDEIHPRNYEYVEKHYSKDIFHYLYHQFYNLWQVNGEDMSVLIDLIYNHCYEELLLRDVERGFGSVYSSNRFQDRINQVLVSFIYKQKRDGNIAGIKAFTLT